MFLEWRGHGPVADMARRAKVTQLPNQVLEELNARLVSGGFQDYTGLSAWLGDMGFSISKSALHAYGQEMEDEFNQAMSQARTTRALARAARESGDDDGALLAAASEILQDQLLRISIALKQVEMDPAEAAKTLSQVSRAFADLGRMAISQQKWDAERMARLQTLESEAKDGKRSIDLETLRIVREELYGA